MFATPVNYVSVIASVTFIMIEQNQCPICGKGITNVNTTGTCLMCARIGCCFCLSWCETCENDICENDDCGHWDKVNEENNNE